MGLKEKAGSCSTTETQLYASQLIYSLCFKELIRQNLVHCIERGALLEKVWNASIDLQVHHGKEIVKLVEEIKGTMEGSLLDYKEFYGE